MKVFDSKVNDYININSNNHREIVDQLIDMYDDIYKVSVVDFNYNNKYITVLSDKDRIMFFNEHNDITDEEAHKILNEQLKIAKQQKKLLENCDWD